MMDLSKEIDMQQVEKEKFFQAIGNMDVHPRPERYRVIWETAQRRVIGESTPGYLCRDANDQYTAETRYFLASLHF